jgi:hypothetical protein
MPFLSPSFHPEVCVCVCVYIYVCVCVYIYIYKNQFFIVTIKLEIQQSHKPDQDVKRYCCCKSDPKGWKLANKRTWYKVIHQGYYWPTLFQICQRVCEEV